MAGTRLDLDDDLVAVLSRLNQPVPEAARELIVMELYRRELVSLGKAAELLGMPHLDFIRHAASLGIPYFRMTADQIAKDGDTVREMQR